MVRRFLLFALFVAAMPAANPPSLDRIQQGSFVKPALLSNPLKLLVWNIDRGSRRAAILNTIRSQHPDVCLLQEVDWNARRTEYRNVASDLARDLSMSYAFAPAYHELNQSSQEQPAVQGQATLTRGAIESARMLRFVRQTGFWEPRPYLPSWFPQRRIGGRIAIVTEIKTSKGPIVFYNLHLESRGFGATRYAQLKEALADVETRYPNAPVVMAGDLNTKYAVGTFVRLLEEHRFQSCLTGPLHKTHRIIGVLDWIFVRGPITCDEGSVRAEGAGSDHYPLTATLHFKK